MSKYVTTGRISLLVDCPQCGIGVTVKISVLEIQEGETKGVHQCPDCLGEFCVGLDLITDTFVWYPDDQ